MCLLDTGVSALLAVGDNAIRRALQREAESAAARLQQQDRAAAPLEQPEVVVHQSSSAQPQETSIRFTRDPAAGDVPEAVDVPRKAPYSLDQVCELCCK